MKNNNNKNIIINNNNVKKTSWVCFNSANSFKT